MATDLACQVVTEPSAWAHPRTVEDVLAELRRTNPVARVEADGYEPFWLITRHADIKAIESDAELFTNHPRSVLQTREMDARLRASAKLRTLVHMDGEEHQHLRAVGANWFRPRNLREIESSIQDRAHLAVDELIGAGGMCDFASQVAVQYPLRVVLSILGLPQEDFPMMLKLTQEVFGAEDPDLQRGDDAAAAYSESFKEFFRYYAKLTEDRRAYPTADLASAIANADIGEYERLSYYILIATAGHDTTSYTLAGGLLALLEHPEQMKALRNDPELIPNAVEEMLRWATPVRHFMRTAQRDTEISGQAIRAGESVMLSYLSANRDEEVFEDPQVFDITRPGYKHLSFGFGAHACMGSNLARMELKLIFTELLTRLDSIELAGEPSYSQSLIVGGLKHLPVRFSVASSG